MQDTIAFTTASLLPAESLAEEAEAQGLWWQAALRWNAFAQFKLLFSNGANLTGAEYLKRAVNASAKVTAIGNNVTACSTSNVQGCTKDELDLFELFTLKVTLFAARLKH